MQVLSLQVLTPCNLQPVERGREFLDLLKRAGSGFVPDLYNTYEPINKPLDLERPDDALQAWRSDFGIYFRKRGSRAFLICAFPGPGGAGHNSITLDLPEKYAARGGGLSLATDLASSLCTWSRADFALLNWLHPRDIEVSQLARTGGSSGQVSLLGNRLASYVPDLYWLTVFGPPYVKLIGRERLLSLDAYKVVELPYGAISVQLSESPLNIRDNYERISAIRAGIKQSIDNNIFFDSTLHPPNPHFVGRTTEELRAKMDGWYGAHKYNVPAFDLSDLQAPPLAKEVEVALRGIVQKRGPVAALSLQEVKPGQLVRFVGFRLWPMADDLKDRGWTEVQKLAEKDLAAHPDADITYVMHRTDAWLQEKLVAFLEQHPRFRFRGTV